MLNRTQFAKYLAIFTVTISLSGCIFDDDDWVGPVVSITNPANAAAIQTPDSIVNIVGSATSDSNIVSVEWVNDRGGEGSAIGAESWNTGSIFLHFGDNNITVTATDSVGLSSSTSIAIERERRSLSAGSATLQWNPPTERVDNSRLTDLAGYEIHYGQSPGSYTDNIQISNPGLSTYVVDDLTNGTWYFSVTAFDSENRLSDFSNEGKIYIP